MGRCVQIKQPMLACSPGPEGVVTFPVLATPKIDGIRALMVKGALVSRTLKPIPNLLLRTTLESVLPDGCDGELMHGETFQSCTSAVMSVEGPPGGFTYHVFDHVCTPSLPYRERVATLARLFALTATKRAVGKVERVVQIKVLVPTWIEDAAGLEDYEQRTLESGFEGVIVRRPDGPYKFGRSTPKEALMLKIKRFEDAEARVTGWEEGRGDVSGMLGALVVERPEDRVTFRVGSGFTVAQRKGLWASRGKQLLGRWVKYKFFRVGTVRAPRFPVFLGFRDVRDM